MFGYIYTVTKRFPKEEIYGLTSQIRRSAVSIPSNIAEGYGRKTTKEYVRFLYIAYGSVCELETQTMISGDLDYMNKEKLQKLREKLGDVENAKSDDQIHRKRTLGSLNPGLLEPFLPNNWKKILFF